MTAPDEALRRELAGALILSKFGEGGLMVFDPPQEATDYQRAVLCARANEALAAADALLAGPIAKHTAALQAEVARLTEANAALAATRQGGGEP